MLYALIFFALLALVFPVGLYPYQDMFRDFLTYVSVILVFLHVVWSKRIRFFYPNFIVFFPAFIGVLVLNYYFSESTVDYSFNWYFLAFFLCLLVAISSASYAASFSREAVSKRLAEFLITAFLFSACFGLMRYYGVLGYIFPVVTQDGDRLIGPMGQPNLLAILTALSLSALIFLKRKEVVTAGWIFYPVIFLMFYIGSLTGSRAWYFCALIALTPIMVDCFRFLKKDWRQNSSSSARSGSTTILAFLVISWAAPHIDTAIAGPLIESGFVDRVSSLEMYEKRAVAGSSGRLDEWQKILNNYSGMEFPWLGYGPGKYGVFSNKYALDQMALTSGRIWNHAHNIFINFFVELGLVGFLVFVFFALYLSFVIYKSGFGARNEFLVSIIIILAAHNLVEFSLWYMPFLALFIFAFALMDRSREFQFSERWIMRFVGVLILSVFLPLGAYVAKDMVEVTKVMYKDQPDFMDQRVLRDAARSSIVGNGALSVLILRFAPPAYAVSNELKMVDTVARWRPEPLFVLRRATLLAASGETERACKAIKNVIELYPDTANAIQDELLYLSGKTDLEVATYLPCIAAGVGRWVE